MVVSINGIYQTNRSKRYKEEKTQAAPFNGGGGEYGNLMERMN